MVRQVVTEEFSHSSGSQGVLLTRLTPPAQLPRLLRRGRVDALLADALEYPLTVVAAPAGSGKTVALAALSAYGGWPAAWCRLSADDDGPLLLRHLAAAFRSVGAIDERRIAMLADSGNLHAALDTLVNELAATLDDETLLVLDDYHLADQHTEQRAIIERLIAVQPLRLHIALATRVGPLLSSLDTARLRGELFEIGAGPLAFNATELRAVATRASLPPPADAEEMVDVACGWPLALQSALGTTDWRAAFGLSGDEARPAPLDGYLADQVLGDLPADLRGGVLRASALRWLDPEAASLLYTSGPVDQLLTEIRRYQLFVHEQPSGRLVFQPIFHTFLARRAQADLADWPALHLRLSEHYRAIGDDEGVLHHLAAAGDPRAADALAAATTTIFAAGQPERVLAWVRRLRAQAGDLPALTEVQAAALRHMGVFDAALSAYGTAEAAFAAAGDIEGQVRALRGQAEVYLDTVQPAPATNLLKRALKLLPRSHTVGRASLLRLQAENWANRGRADVALILERAARDQEAGARRQERLAPGFDAQLPPRLLLRAGRLNEARQQVEAQLRIDGIGGDLVIQRGAHREPLLLLSLIYAMLGGGTRSLAMARRSLEEAQQAGSRLTEAIAELRLGHAYQLAIPSDTAPAQSRYAAGMQ
ncbi:MAG: transcriptional regulator, partial [Oscillochloris sp.]|nr:transcriptional regulator [Oscillochloris sp.]